jgi:hypothetical protein
MRVPHGACLVGTHQPPRRAVRSGRGTRSRLAVARAHAPSMGRMRGAHQGERGSLILMLAVLFVALLALAGIVIDGGAKLDEAQLATAIAQEAARAGAGMVNRAQAYAAGTFTVDKGQALAAARQYLAEAGYHGSVWIAGPDSIGVTVRLTEPTKVLSIIGIRTMTSTGSAIANLVTGVTGPGR